MKGLRPGFNPKASAEFTTTVVLVPTIKSFTSHGGNVAVYLLPKKEN